jgi:hypothetical protein
LPLFLFLFPPVDPTVKENPMKLTLPSPKPRNPFLAASLRRLAGSHRTGGGARRQQAQRALRQEIERLRRSP